MHAGWSTTCRFRNGMRQLGDRRGELQIIRRLPSKYNGKDRQLGWTQHGIVLRVAILRQNMQAHPRLCGWQGECAADLVGEGLREISGDRLTGRDHNRYIDDRHGVQCSSGAAIIGRCGLPLSVRSGDRLAVR